MGTEITGRRTNLGTLDGLGGAWRSSLPKQPPVDAHPQQRPSVEDPTAARLPQPAVIESNPPLYRLFASFLRLGLTAFGGPAMIPYIRRLAVERKRWLDGASFRDGLAFCQTIPGATAMQMSAYVGLRASGLPGALGWANCALAKK